MRLIPIIIALLIISVSCNQEHKYENLILAEEYITLGQYDQAQQECDLLLKEKSLTDFTISQLTQLSIMYMKLSERINEESNIATATKCYITANNINSDSVSEYISSLPIEDERHINMLQTLLYGINTPDSIAVAYDIDSLSYNTGN